MSIEILGLSVTIVLALLGYSATYINNLRLARRADRLRFITAQIDELYGPLYVITQSSKILFLALQVKLEHLEKETAAGGGKKRLKKPADELSEWRIWNEEVFQPLNVQLEQVIIYKAHLIIEEEMPQCLKRFLAHSAGYKAVIKKWQMGDFSERSSVINFPGEIEEYAETSYLKLKAQQKKLIGR